MQIGFVGLGRMGANMVKRLRELGDHEVVAYDQSSVAVDEISRSGATGVGSLRELVAALRPPRAIGLMVPSGDPVDQTRGALVDHVTPGDLFVDGGNSYYKDSVRRAREVAARGVELLDAGTSGGVWGRQIGYTTMIGGSPEGFARIEPAIRTLAPENGYAHLGPRGAGHFAKMVHNGIAYGMMQSDAEGFAIIERSPFGYDLWTLANLWNHGSVIRSWLLELAADAFEQDSRLDQVSGFVEDTGEGRWTVAAAIEESVPAPVITQARYARFRSREPEDFGNKVVAVLRKEFGGHAVRPTGGE